MKKLVIFSFVAALLLCISGCGTDATASASGVSDSTPLSSSSVSQETAGPQFARPADVFDFEKATGDQADKSIVIEYDDMNRIKRCEYTTASGMPCRAIYTYNDTYAHIFTFGGNMLSDDLVIHCEYSEGAAPIVINGYYFINIKSNESEK